MRVRRKVVAASAVSLVVGLSPALIPHGSATAAPASPAVPVAAHAPSAPGSTRFDATATLITGDVVSVKTGSDGEPAVSFDAARRADATPVSYTSWGSGDDYYVVPSDVAPLIGTKIDLNLFDVPRLADVAKVSAELQKSSSATSASAAAVAPLPVIVQRTPAKPGHAAPAAPAWGKLGVHTHRTLESIGSVSGDVPATGAPALLDALKSGASIDHVWLDAPVRTTDAESSPAIGAPAAWASGYDGTGVTVGVLDTGIDTSHPDLAGVVTLSKDFTGTGGTGDGVGHGTHVASIIAGSGAASGGVDKGVAPGVHILNGRVFNPAPGNAGVGEESWWIDGLEWAASNGADIVNMSLGDDQTYTDGTDPAALAVDAVSAKYGTLVVIAAGNDGYHGDSTVTTPGTADSALTVGAVDDSGAHAGFSSVGPRAGDFAIKPDITAPGVDIVAARAAGTSDGDVVDDNYTSLSGTSMATPAVVGVAALLKQARPELTGQALKSVLMGAAHTTGNSVFAEGSGEVNAPSAIHETVFAQPASLSYGVFRSPRATEAPLTKSVTYSNDSDADVELHLAVSDNTQSGQAAAAGAARLSADTLDIPAHGSASVDVTIDPQADAPGVFAGVLSAAGVGFQPVRTVLAYQVEPQLNTITMKTSGFASGQSVEGVGVLLNIDESGQAQWLSFMGSTSVRVLPGRYAFIGDLAASTGEEGDSNTMVTADFDVSAGDATTVLDEGDAEPIVVTAPKATLATNVYSVMTRDLPGWSYPIETEISNNAGYLDHVTQNTLALSEGSLAGTLDVETKAVLQQPLLNVAVKGGGAPTDESAALIYALRSPRLTGTVDAQLVDAGTGTPAELAAAKVAGKIAIVQVPHTWVDLNAQSAAAQAAGAKALIAWVPTPGPFAHQLPAMANPGDISDQGVPTFTAGYQTAQFLLARAHSAARLQGSGLANANYQYALDFAVHGSSVPASLAFTPDPKSLAVVPLSIHAAKAGTLIDEDVDFVRDGSFLGMTDEVSAPLDRTVYYSTGGGIGFIRNMAPATHLPKEIDADNQPVFPEAAPFSGAPKVYTPGTQPAEAFFGDVHGGLGWNSGPNSAAVVRDGDSLTLNLPARVDSSGHQQEWGPDAHSTDAMRVLQGDSQLAAVPYVGGLTLGAASSSQHFRIQADTRRSTDWWKQSTHVTTEWGFTSSTTAAPTVLPLLQLDYGVQGLDNTNTAPRSTVLTLQPSHQAGSSSTAKVNGVKLWSSADGGATWVPVTVKTAPGGGLTAVVTVQKGATSVSLKTHAADAAGATFDETVIDAYSVR